jgi:RNA polymerase sigma factor (sigma-70 family)
MDGDEVAWARLVSRYERLVYAVALHEGLDAHDAADVTQVVFESLVQSIERIREPERLGYWLMTVARRTSWRRRSVRRREVSFDDDALDRAVLVVDDQWELAVDVFDAIMGLDEPCRSLIVGLFLDPAQPSYQELAAALGMSIGSIGPLRARCLAKLRVLLAAEASS